MLFYLSEVSEVTLTGRWENGRLRVVGPNERTLERWPEFIVVNGARFDFIATKRVNDVEDAHYERRDVATVDALIDEIWGRA